MYLCQGLRVKQLKSYPINKDHSLNTVGLDFRVMKLDRNLVRLYKNISCEDGRVGELIIDIPEKLIGEYFCPIS